MAKGLTIGKLRQMAKIFILLLQFFCRYKKNFRSKIFRNALYVVDSGSTCSSACTHSCVSPEPEHWVLRSILPCLIPLRQGLFGTWSSQVFFGQADVQQVPVVLLSPLHHSTRIIGMLRTVTSFVHGV